MKLSSIIWTAAEHSRQYQKYLEFDYKPSNYVRRRLGDLATRDDAKRWALILYCSFFESILFRSIPFFLRDARWLDIFPTWSVAASHFIRYRYKEAAYRLFLGLLPSDDKRLVLGALICLSYLDRSILLEFKDSFLSALNGIKNKGARSFAFRYFKDIVAVAYHP